MLCLCISYAYLGEKEIYNVIYIDFIFYRFLFFFLVTAKNKEEEKKKGGREEGMKEEVEERGKKGGRRKEEKKTGRPYAVVRLVYITRHSSPQSIYLWPSLLGSSPDFFPAFSLTALSIPASS